METITKKQADKLQDTINLMNASNVTYESIKNALEFAIKKYEIPAVVEDAVFNSGGFLSKGDNCIAILHPDHRTDYFKYCIFKASVGTTCTIDLYAYGKSKNIAQESFAENTKIFDGQGRKDVIDGIRKGGYFGAGYAIGGAIAGVAATGIKVVAKGVNALLRDTQALEEEKAWYNAMNCVIMEVLELE